MSQARLFSLTLATLALAVAVVPMWWIFGTPRLVLVAVIAILAGVGIAVLGWWRRWSALSLLLLGIVAFIVLAPPLAATETLAGVVPTLESYAVVVPALWESWRDILTIATPVGAEGGVLVAPLALLLAAGVIGGSVALRARWAELATLPAAAVFVWGILFGPRNESLPVLQAVLMVAAIAAHVTAVRQQRRRRNAPRTLSSLSRRVGAGVMVAATALVVGVVGGGAELGERVVLRSDEPPSAIDDVVRSPLAAFRAAWSPERRDDALFTVTGLEAGDRVTLAVLDGYDGEVAYVDGRFVRTPAGAPASGDVLGVTVASAQTPFVIHVDQGGDVGFVGDRASRLGATLHRDDETGTVITEAGLREGDSFEIGVTRRVAPPVADLVPTGELQLDVDPPAEAVEWLAAQIGDAATPGERLSALVAGFAADGYISHGVAEDEPPSRAGHSLARIAELFNGVMIGDDEQYAVAGALLAEQLGFPARVVVGYRPTVVDGGATVIRGTDSAAWIEVHTRSAGWVPVDVVPPARPVPEDQPAPPRAVEQPPQPLPPVAAEGGVEPSGAPAPPGQPENAPPAANPLTGVLMAFAMGVGVLALLAAPFLAVLAVKVFRRFRRRRAATPRARVGGSWREFVDAAVDRGRQMPGTMTRTEYARTEDERDFARDVDAALFGRDEVDDAEATSLWSAAEALIAKMDADTSSAGRLRSRLSPRSFRRHPR